MSFSLFSQNQKMTCQVTNSSYVKSILMNEYGELYVLDINGSAIEDLDGLSLDFRDQSVLYVRDDEGETVVAVNLKSSNKSGYYFSYSSKTLHLRNCTFSKSY